MSTTIEVMDLKGAAFCPKCAAPVRYDFNGRPPLDRVMVTCHCGLTFFVRRLPLRSSLGPKEVK